MKRLTFSILFLLTIAVLPTTLQAQGLKDLFKIRKNNKILREENASLRLRLDSLQNLVEESIPIIDTITINDTINPGGLSFFDSEDFMEPEQCTDSLLNIWYVQNALTLDDDSIIDLDSVSLSSDIPDSVYIERLKSINSYIQLPYNNIVKNHIIYYSQKIPNKIDLILGLSPYYLPQFEEIFDLYDLPKELKVMAIIESALNPRAVSRANAKGMWQFMYRTALSYNLKIDSYVDERLDPIASAHAAAKYLKDSYSIFGDWLLAIASYNCGPGNVNKAIRRANSREFWDVYPYLPRETRGYVPSFVAALYTLHYYKEHRITPRMVEFPAHVDTFIIKKPLHFGQIAELLEISKEEIAEHNPQYLKEFIPGNEKGYILRLPYTLTNAFIEIEDEVYSYKDSIYTRELLTESKRSAAAAATRQTTHVVRRGETLSHIALRYKVRVADLQRWNGVKTNIRVGQRLIVHSSAVPAASGGGGTTTSGGYVIYTVKRGDSLWNISKKFNGVTLNDIMRLNNLNKNSKIYPGTKLKIRPA